MRYSIGQGYADSVPVSSLLSPATQCVFAATARSPAEFLCSWRKFLSLNDLPPLGFSLLSFPYSRPFFSSACSLFFQNAGGCGVPRRNLPALCVSALSFAFTFVAPWHHAAWGVRSPILAPISARSIYL